MEAGIQYGALLVTNISFVNEVNKIAFLPLIFYTSVRLIFIILQHKILVSC